jgi:small acid-soluble spore protein D (minor alpha/beta-type SASP)
MILKRKGRGRQTPFDRPFDKENLVMASNKTLVPEAKQALEQFKMQAANEVGVTLNQGYNGQLTSQQAGSIGGQMVKKMVESYENSLKTK